MGPSRPFGVAARPTVSTQPQASSPSPPPPVDDKGAAVQRATKRRDAHTRALPCTDTPPCTERVSAARVVDSHTKARERAESRRVNLHPAAPWRHPLPSVCSRIGEEEDLRRRRRRRSIRISSSSPRFLRTELFPLSFLFVARLEKLFPFSCFSRRTGRERNLENGRRSFYEERCMDYAIRGVVRGKLTLSRSRRRGVAPASFVRAAGICEQAKGAPVNRGIFV